MKVLWLGGIVLPRIAKREELPVNYMNGWLIKLSEELTSSQQIKLVYVFDSNRNIEGSTKFYSYYGIQCNKASTEKFGYEYIKQVENILKKENPDIVHIWGTENSHSLAMVEACTNLGLKDSVVISIQGLVSKYFYHYYAYLPHYVVVDRTLRDIVKGNIADGAKEFRKRGLLEEEAIRGVKHVIGRTEWDRACAWDINPTAKYHFNNETLRDEFYSGCWDQNACERYSIFCSQGHYPIKGIHLVIEALRRVVQEYPNAHLYIGGKDYISLPFWRQSSYGKYLVKLIKKYGLENNIFFTGFLNANQMKERYLKANVFVSASSIENSPNSLGEAMLLGVPCIASHVGGVHNLMEHGKEGYIYPADETYILAYYICDLFRNTERACEFGKQARNRALKTHNPEKNQNDLIQIYSTIIEEGCSP